MARQFKPVRFFVMMSVAAFAVVLRDSVLHSSRGSRPNGGRTCSLCHRRESWRASAARHKVTDGCRIEHDGSEAFQAGGNRQPAGLGPRLKTVTRTGSRKRIRISSFELKDFERPFLRQCLVCTMT